jgi:hypothetical protein
VAQRKFQAEGNFLDAERKPARPALALASALKDKSGHAARQQHWRVPWKLF